jgi:hypothetical protein
MLSYDQRPIPQREPLIRIIHDRRVKRMRVQSHIPHLNAKGEVAGDVVQVRIGRLPKQFVNAEISFEEAPNTSMREASAR